jgi:hypothetical protein
MADVAMELGISAKSVGEWVRLAEESDDSKNSSTRASRLGDHEHPVAQNVLARNFDEYTLSIPITLELGHC